MKRTIKDIRKEMRKRGIKIISGNELALWGVIFAIEDLQEVLKIL